MSKSYHNRCKACVAEHTRMVRQEAKNHQSKPTEPIIDWEQRRYELAMQAMVAMIDNKKISQNVNLLAFNAVEIATAMIQELKAKIV